MIREIASYFFTTPAYLLVLVAEIIKGEEIMRTRDIIAIKEAIEKTVIECAECGHKGKITFKGNHSPKE